MHSGGGGGLRHNKQHHSGLGLLVFLVVLSKINHLNNEQNFQGCYLINQSNIILDLSSALDNNIMLGCN